MNQLTTNLLPPPAERKGFFEDDIDLRHYWNVVWREKWGIAGLVAVVALLAVVVLLNLTPVYRATATLLVEAQQANVVSIQEVYGIDSSQREYFATQFEILNSRKLAEEVIEELGIANHPEFDPAQQKPLLDWRRFVPFAPARKPLTPAQSHQEVVEKFQLRLSVQPIRNTQLVKISFESADPELTYNVANAIGDAYIEEHLEARLELTQKAADWLTSRLSDMRTELDASERRLQQYREQQGLVDVSGVQTLSAKEIDEITQRLVEARNRAQISRSQYEAVGDVSSGYDSRWETLPGVLSDELARELKQAEAEAGQFLSELARRYGPKHPKWIAAESSFNKAEEAYQARVIKVVSGFEKAYKQALADQRELEQSFNRSKGEIQDINRKLYELSQLEREAKTNRELYDLFFTRFKETGAANFEAANARFVDRAVLPFIPVKPRKALMLALIIILTGMAGVILAFLKDMLDRTVKSAAEVEEKLGQPVIGVLPRIHDRKQNERAFEAVTDESQHGFGEAVKTTRTGVVLASLDKPLKTLVMTSSVPGEGKTTLSMNLAIALGQIENIVLIDADMRRPSVAENCGLPHRTAGLSTVIAGNCTLEEATHEFQGIDVIPAGVVPPNPLELLSSNRFRQLLQELGEKYDRVLIDSAPTQAVSDSMVLSSHADGVIYVVKSDATPTQIARDGIQRLIRVNANLLGVALNQFDPESAARYGGYGKGYYDYYGYGSSKGYN